MCPHHVTAAHANQACWILPLISDNKKQWLRLQTHPPLISHHCYIYTMCLTTFICCGCAYGCVPTTLRPPMPTKPWEFRHKSRQVSSNKWQWKVVIEAVHPSTTHLTSLLYIYMVVDNLYMLWMCIWMCPHHVMAAHANLAFGILLEFWVTSRR